LEHSHRDVFLDTYNTTEETQYKQID